MILKPEDLEEHPAMLTHNQVVIIVNEWIQKQLKDAPVVFCGPDKGKGRIIEEWSLAEYVGEDTHKAKLICIEEL